MKKLILASALAPIFFSHGTFAQEAAAPDHQFAYSATLTSDYRFRGISQTQKEAALQFTADYTNNPTGLYAGAFLSNIKWVKANALTWGGDDTAPVEIDFYGGKRGDLGAGFSYDVGGIYYYFPGESLKSIPGIGRAANTLEAYGQLGYGPVYLKYSYALTDTFATGDRGSYYIDAGANFPLMEKWVLNAHAGRQHFEGQTAGNYEDFKLGLTNDFGFATGSIAYINTTGNTGFFTWNGTKVAGEAVVVSATKAF